MEKPALHPKSDAVLLAADEIRAMKQRLLKKSLSTSDIYDDIISIMKEEDYDDILSVFSGKQNNVTASSLVNTLPRSRSSEDLYDDVVITKLSSTHRAPQKPKAPHKPDSIFNHPSVRALQDKRNDWEFEEIYDTAVPLKQPHPDRTAESDTEEVYVNPNMIEVSSESEGEYVISSLRSPLSKAGTAMETTNSKSPTPPVTVASIGNGDVYEDLVLYEDVEKYQKQSDEYEDPTTVVVKALELPKNMRQRATRLVRGPQRTKLRKSVKKRSRVMKSGSVDTVSKEWEPKEGEDTNSDSEPVSQVPLERAKKMFDMLLDASDVRRVADPGTNTAMKEPIPEVTASGESGEERQDDNHNDYFNSEELLKLQQCSELQPYKEAGVIQLRSKSAIAADIAMLTANAPKEPPPLPGMSRPRAVGAAKPDLLLQKRMRMKKANTIQ